MKYETYKKEQQEICIYILVAAEAPVHVTTMVIDFYIDGHSLTHNIRKKTLN